MQIDIQEVTGTAAMHSLLFDFHILQMFPIFKQSESNIVVQDPAQNSTNERTNIPPSTT